MSLLKSLYAGVIIVTGLGLASPFTEAGRLAAAPAAESKTASAEKVEGYRKVAEQGDAMAQVNLGDCYANGIGITKNESEAVKWYRKAADQGLKPAKDALLRLAQGGNVMAQFNLGLCYEKEPRNRRRGYYQPESFLLRGQTNDTEAVKWFRKAAEQGYAEAQNKLGSCHEYGIGTTRDCAEAVRWYRKSAENGWPAAQYDIGSRYEKGIGIVKDEAEAVRWHHKAADQGFEPAKEALRKLGK